MSTTYKTHTPIPDPFKQWLEANDVDLDQTPNWPVIEWDDDTPGTIRVEQFAKMPYPDGTTGPVLGWRTVITAMVDFPVKVPVPEHFREIYDVQAVTARSHDALVQMLRRIDGVNVITLADDPTRILFVVREQWEPQDAEEFLSKVNMVLPGLLVSVVSGVQGIVIADTIAESRSPSWPA